MSTALIRPGTLGRPSKGRPELGTYFVQTWGCQMNEEDSEQLGLHLEGLGFRRASDARSAQVVLLNTCSVRRKPEDKAFSFLGELALLKQQHPELVVGVCGCMAQIRAEEIHRRAPFVDFVVGTAQLAQVPALVQEALQTRRFAARLGLPERRGTVVTDIPSRAVGREAKLKAFVPIQYGCDKFCSFCIVPTTRGRERSRPTEEIVQEVSALAARGTREVTLLGQTVNSYGKNLAEGRVSFAELLSLLNGVPGLERIRYTSPYPRDFRGDLIHAIRDLPKVMEHLHMPLQSGCDPVLRRMKRIYSVESFRQIVSEVRAKIPHVSITTDMIVGFPGETDSEFDESLEFMESMRFDGAYMFAYSTRPGTPATEMKDQVPEPVKKARLNAMIAMQNQISQEIHASLVGQAFEVLVEGPSPKNPWVLQGYTREFKMMHFEGPSHLRGERVLVRATRAHLWGLSGEVTE